MTLDTFSALGCSEPFLSNLTKRGFHSPTLVQMESFKPGLEGRDLLVQSRTGSGKTLAFGLPIMHRLTEDRHPQAIILTPTRELAQQVGEELQSVMPHLDIALLVGGLSYIPQLKALKHGARVVVGTPGRIQDHLSRGTLNLSMISMVVLDECDEMLNMGFIDDVEEILSKAPSLVQTFLFSATLPGPIANLAKRFLKNPHRINHSQDEGTSQHADIKHTPCLVADNLHTKALVNFLLADEPSSALIFTKMKITTETVAQSLRDAGFSADCLHGDLSQQTRNRILNLFKSGKLRYLVATDVAARGIDIEAMPLVVHMGIPTQMESYIHRSGRTGRAGAKGASLALVNPKESRILLAWSRRGGLQLEWRSLPNRTEIREIRAKKLFEHIASIEAPIHLDSASKMLAGRDAQSLVAALLSKIVGNSQDGYDLPSSPKYDSSTEKSQYSNRSGDRREQGHKQRPSSRKYEKPNSTPFAKRANSTGTKRSFDHTNKQPFRKDGRLEAKKTAKASS